jgi:hypothetical protein
MSIALDRALSHIADTFRDERKAHVRNILNFAHAVELSEAGRFTMQEAMQQMSLTGDAVRESVLWLETDNADLNRLYETALHNLDSVQQNVKKQLAA